jgi:PAS domain S-box-containing protein
MTKRQLSETTVAFGRFIESMPDMAGIVDRDGSYRQVNRAWTDRLGYSVQDMDGIRFRDLFTPTIARLPATPSAFQIQFAREKFVFDRKTARFDGSSGRRYHFLNSRT